MTKLPKVGDKIKWLGDWYYVPGLETGDVGTVTKVNKNEKNFILNSENNFPCVLHEVHWENLGRAKKKKNSPKKKAVQKSYIISKQILEALNHIPGVIGDEVRVVVVDE